MERIEDCISFVVGKAAQQISRRARELLAPHNVTPVQYAALKVLSHSDGMSGRELGERLVLDSATITGIIDRLEVLSLIERRPDPSDRRARRLHLTGEGRLLQPDLDHLMDRLNDEAALMVTGQDVEELKSALRGLSDKDGWAKAVEQ